MGGAFSLHRQDDAEGAAAPGGTVHFDPSGMFIDDAFGNGQA
jgi:hypothetical protein